MFDSYNHELRHARLSCPSLSLEFAQTHVHWVGTAIQPCHPLLPPSPPAISLSQNQDLSQWVGSSHQMAQSTGASASVLPVNIQGLFPLGLNSFISSKLQKCYKKEYCYYNDQMIYNIFFFKEYIFYEIKTHKTSHHKKRKKIYHRNHF